MIKLNYNASMTFDTNLLLYLIIFALVASKIETHVLWFFYLLYVRRRIIDYFEWKFKVSCQKHIAVLCNVNDNLIRYYYGYYILIHWHLITHI